ADQSFDLIIANSVLSHLTLPVAREWLTEMRRLLSPNGLALLSYHGDFSATNMFSRHRQMFETVLETGFNADLRASELDEQIGDREYYRQTFMSDAFAKTMMGDYFSVEEQLVGRVSRYQNIAVLRKK
ncbi:MAG: class I SAM-dependent methyltransferase, partial [Peristeroidobacter soli]